MDRKIIDFISINEHSSIRLETSKIIYFDPFRIKEIKHDADLILITHSHFDHFSKEDIEKINNINSKIICPLSMEKELKESNFKNDIIYMSPNEEIQIGGINIKAISSYNVNKPMHPKDNKWLGYIIEVDNTCIYVAGDSDVNEDNLKVKCDVAMVPVGGFYTMNHEEAAFLVNKIKPAIAIPTHYGTLVGEKIYGDLFASLVSEDIEVIKKIVF